MSGLSEAAGLEHGQIHQEQSPSLPLYAAGFVITLCGILAANAALTEPDFGWMTDTIMLSGLGFLFSYGSRRLGIAPRALDFGCGAAALLALACIAAGQINVVQLLPLGADRRDLQLMSGLVWGSTLWSWALRSDNRVVITTIPAMAVLGMAATIDVNTPVLVCFGAFILTVIFLLIHQNFLQNRGRAAGRPDAAPRRLLLAQFAQAGVCGLAVLLAGILVIIPAQAVFQHLSLAQAIRHLAAIQADPGNPAAIQRFSDDDNLAIGTGDAWSASPDVVMRVTPSDGQPHYWRGRTYDVYTGDGWQSSLEDDQKPVTASISVRTGGAFSPGIPDTEGESFADALVGYSVGSGLTPGDLAQPAARPPLTTTCEVRGETNQFYYAGAPRQIIFNALRDSSGIQTWSDGRLGLHDGGVVRFQYQVVSALPPDLSQPGVADRLRQAGTAYPDIIKRLYLLRDGAVQPDDLAFYRQCVTDALQNLPSDQRDPLDEAEALRGWVSRRCVYTLTPPALPDDSDHVHAFLGDTRKGYCDMFASSLAVLCRTAGIPARLAVGFAPGDPDGTSFNLRAEDKHAWTEVYFPGTGWIEMDATAGTQTDGTVPSAASSRKLSWLSRLHLPSGDWNLIYPLVGLILAIAAYVAKTEIYDPWRRNRRRPAPSAPQARQRLGRALTHPYARLTQSLASIGLPRRPEETPREYADRVLPLLPPLEQEWGVLLPGALVSDLTAAFTEAAYSNPAAPPPPARPWDSRLAAFESAARQVARARFWQRVFRLGREPQRTGGMGNPGKEASFGRR